MWKQLQYVFTVFQGRTNKLVDGCYSFWVGGIFPLLHQLLNKGELALVSSGITEERHLCRRGGH